ncbi:MAG: site-specific integrase, partial [Crenarchaeota archaeon]|nr:site-specific integrase [Thermoproteota archaeon]
MKTNEEYIQEWLNRLQNACNKSPLTIRNYRSQLNQFNIFINKPFTEVTCEDIEGFVSGEKEIKTKQLKQSVVCNFFNWMSDRNYVSKHPMMSRLTFGRNKKQIRFLEVEQINKCNEL